MEQVLHAGDHVERYVDCDSCFIYVILVVINFFLMICNIHLSLCAPHVKYCGQYGVNHASFYLLLEYL